MVMARKRMSKPPGVRRVVNGLRRRREEETVRGSNKRSIVRRSVRGSVSSKRVDQESPQIHILTWRYCIAFRENASSPSWTYFPVPLTQQTVIEKKRLFRSIPIIGHIGLCTIGIFIAGNGDDYVDLNNTMIYLRVKITRPNGEEIAHLRRWV